MGVKIKKEIVEAVKSYAVKYPTMPQAEIAVLTGVSASTVSGIVNGQYDHLLVEEERVVTTDIPYEEYQRLVLCSLAVDEIFDNLRQSTSTDEYLFVDFRKVAGVLRRFFQERYDEKYDEIFCEEG